MRMLAAAFVVVLIVIHQDFWNWRRSEPLLFGFIPIGLAWHVMISLLAAALAWFMARYCWPAFVDAMESAKDDPLPPRGH